MVDPRLIVAFWIALAVQGTPLIAQNSRINENGRQQMNDAAPVDGALKYLDLDEQTPVTSQRVPESSSPSDTKNAADEDVGSGDGNGPLRGNDK